MPADDLELAAKTSDPVPTWCPLWDGIFIRKEWGKYPPEFVVRFVARNFYAAEDRSRVRIMDLGCGPGGSVWYMAREGFTVAGIDGSEVAIGRARDRLAREGLSADLRVGDYSALPWPTANFDGVVECASLYCNPWANILITLREVRRVLKPGAVFQCAFFSDHTWGYGQGKMVEEDGFVDLREGPLVGAGFCLFLKRERISELFRDFSDLNVERVSWTEGGERHLIEMYVVACRTPK